MNVHIEPIAKTHRTCGIRLAKNEVDDGNVENAPIINKTNLSGRCRKPIFAFTPSDSERAVT